MRIKTFIAMFNVVKTLPKKPPIVVIKKTKSGAKKVIKKMSDCITEQHYSKYKIEGYDKNFFTDLIDKMMMDEFFDEKFKVKFDNVCKTRPDKKRLAILGKIDNGKGIIADIMALKDNYVPKMTHIEDIIIMLRKYIKYGMSAKTKEFGEVATPLELVRDMIKSFPDSENIWSNPHLKWLDPCNGTGPFLSMVIRKLMKGLENYNKDGLDLRDEEKRYKHIVENMIYCCEIQPKNMFLWMFFADPYDQYLLNVYPDSYLDEGFNNHMKNVWGIEKFDVIIGNPPYQERKEGNKKSQALWHKFVEKSLSLLNNDGFLSLVHPSGWRDIDGLFKATQKIMIDKEIHYLAMFSESDGMKTFGMDTRYDFYIIKNKLSNKDFLSKIRCQDGSIIETKLHGMEFIPNGMFEEIMSLVAKKGEEKTKVIGDSSYHTQRDFMKKEPDTTYIYPCVYTVKSGDEMTLWYSNKDTNGHFGIPKLIWSNFRISSAGSIADIDGKYALTQFSYGIIDDKDKLLDIKKAFDTKKFRNMMENCSVANMSINRKIIATFRKDFWKEFI